VFAPDERRSWGADTLLKWAEGPTGQHIELGISEMNLFLLLGQLGLSGDLSGQPLLPVGTVYDPFVLRGLDAFIHAVYSGSRFVVAGTPSGVTLAPEGGAHQSTITASVGLELPEVTLIEPAYGVALDWLLCDALGRIATGRPASPAPSAAAAEAEEHGAYYFRLTTRPIDQAPFEAARARLGDAVLRRQVLAGAYRLVDATGVLDADAPQVSLVASGAVLPEVLVAAAELASEGIAAHVVDVTSLDRLYGPGSDRCARRSGPRPRPRSRVRCGPCCRTGLRWSPCTTPRRTRWPGSGRRSACRRCPSASTGSASPAPSPTYTRCTTSTPARSSTPPWPPSRSAERSPTWAASTLMSGGVADDDVGVSVLAPAEQHERDRPRAGRRSPPRTTFRSSTRRQPCPAQAG
jgi:hypothetical protein